MITSPEVGGSSPTTMRATVVFPEPDSPTSAKVSPLAMSKRHAVDRLQEFQMAAFEHPVQPWLGDIEHAAQILDLDKGGRRHAAISLRGGVVEMAGNGLRAPAGSAPAARSGSGRTRRRSAD